MRRITFYTKEGCSLCEEALETIDRISVEYDLEVEVVDILKSKSIWMKYRHLVPVVVIDGNLELYGRIEEQKIRELLGSPRKWPSSIN